VSGVKIVLLASLTWMPKELGPLTRRIGDRIGVAVRIDRAGTRAGDGDLAGVDHRSGRADKTFRRSCWPRAVIVPVAELDMLQPIVHSIAAPLKPPA
jgi:hypothetical protein